MMRWNKRLSSFFICLVGFVFVLASTGFAQSSPNLPARHVGFNSPEGWTLKYFTSETMLSGLQPPEAPEEEGRLGSITVRLEPGWLPNLNADRARVGFG